MIFDKKDYRELETGSHWCQNFKNGQMIEPQTLMLALFLHAPEFLVPESLGSGKIPQRAQKMLHTNISYLTVIHDSSLVIDELGTRITKSPERRACVAYLYCDYRDEKNQTAINMIGALLKQVLSTLSESKSIPQDVFSLLQERWDKEKSFELDEVQQLLAKTVRRLSKVYICVDALDECKAENRSTLLQSLATVAKECGQECWFRIFTTGRLHVKLADYVRQYPGLGNLSHIILEANSDDIRRYVEHAIQCDDNECMNDTLKAEILERIVNTSDKMLVSKDLFMIILRL
jgi:hypothetical protein